jgi:hypothetical protein
MNTTLFDDVLRPQQAAPALPLCRVSVVIKALNEEKAH